MRKLLRRVQYLFRRNRMAAELAEEMALHRELLARDSAAGSAAARVWGNATLAQEDARGVWLAPWVESFWQDFAYAVRGLRRDTGFALVAIAALAVAIGLNTALFTVFNAIALRPWPVKDSARVVNVARIRRSGPGSGIPDGFGAAEWRYFSAHSKAFAGLILTRNGERVEAEGQPLNLTWVTGNYFSVLGVDMARGRGFLPEEDSPQAPAAVVALDFKTWRNRFGGDPSIVGKTIRLNEIPFTVVGVAPEAFTGTGVVRADFWAPLSARRVLRPHDASVLPFLTKTDYCCTPMAGRLAPSYTREQGAAEIAILASQLQPQQESPSTVVALGTEILQTAGRGEGSFVPVLAAMFLAMTLVLLLACANVGNLLLARGAARRTEIGVRLSLGGSRLRLIRQLLVESFTLALAAAALGMAIAWSALSTIFARTAPEIAIVMNPDWRVCLYTVGLASLACLVFGLAPALQSTGGQLSGALKQDARLVAGRFPLRSVLLAAQVAISVVLLAGAGLLVRGVQRAERQDPGFRVDSVTVASLDLPAADYSGERSQAFTASLRDALARTEGLPATAIATDAPMSNSRSFTSMRGDGDTPARHILVQMHEVTAAYFGALRIPLVAGRNFTREDAGRNVVLLNQTSALRLWGDENAVGKKIESNEKTWEVVGVVKDAYTTDLGAIQPALYWPMTGDFGAPLLLIADANAAVRDRVANIVRDLEPRGRVTFTPLSDNLKARLAPAKYGAVLAGALGLLALALASIGMAGVFAYTVGQRRREIGVRMALGANPAQVVRLVLASNLRSVAWGLAVGLAGSFAIARLLKNLMNGVAAFDPVAYAAVFGLLIAAAIAASALPAWRAACVDPLTALRWE